MSALPQRLHSHTTTRLSAAVGLGTGDKYTKSPANPLGLAGPLVLATSYSRTTLRRTTIGAAAFHCRVRNGNGWGHCAKITRVRRRTGISLLRSDANARPNL